MVEDPKTVRQEYSLIRYSRVVYIFNSTTLFTYVINQHAFEKRKFYTPLHYAAHWDRKRIVKILLEKISGDKNPRYV